MPRLDAAETPNAFRLAAIWRRKHVPTAPVKPPNTPNPNFFPVSMVTQVKTLPALKALSDALLGISACLVAANNEVVDFVRQ